MAKLLCLFTASLLFAASSVSSTCTQQDLTALLAFKNSFPANSSLSSWTTNSDCCSWAFINCDATTGRVTSISISHSYSLIGSIPPSIGDLSTLQFITFSDLPGLSGPIPSQLSKLTALQSLTIYSTKVSGPIPPFLSSFTSLKQLQLAHSSFTGTVPASLGNLISLNTIDLSSNKLTGTIPATLFSKLAAGTQANIDLSSNMLTGPIPQSFNNIAFGNINMGSNQLTGDASFLFGRSKTAFLLLLQQNKLAFDLTSVQYPVNLGSLDISHNNVFGSINSQITELKGLSYLNVSYNMLCGKIPSGGNIASSFGASSFAPNRCLCGTPLPLCKAASI